jgi:hypothetical protein
MADPTPDYWPFENLWYRQSMGDHHNSSLRRRFRFRPLVSLATIFFALSPMLLFLSQDAASQQRQDAPGDEIVANLSAGRVIIAVVKDAILIATIENAVEPQTRLPTPVDLGSRRTGVFLGAVEWTSPASHLEIARLDSELPHLHSPVASMGPHLQQAAPDAEATDIDSVGHGVAERLNQIARNLHGKISLPPNEPVAELILADYVQSYGPEIWQLTFTLQQAIQREDYYDTHVPLPQYRQFWPPEKGQPKTLVEFQYPPEDSRTALIDRIRQNDPGIDKLCSTDAKMRDVRDRFVRGESNKILAVDAIQFLRAALNIVASPNTRETFAVVNEETGFSWILRPPAEAPRPSEQKERPPEAPSLLQPH